VCYVIVPRVALLHEWYKEFTEQGIEPSRIGGNHRDELSEVNIITINTARKMLKDADPTDALLIVDEVHRSSSAKNRQIYRPNWEHTLGLSATAFQGGAVIAKLCGGIVYDYNFEDALADGVVNDYRITNIGYTVDADTNRGLTQMAEQLRILRGIITNDYGGPGSDDQWPMYITQLIQEYDEPNAISMQHLWLERKRLLWSSDTRTDITCALVEKHENERIVIFHQEIEGVEKIYASLKEDEYDVVMEHSGRHRKDREAALDAFRDGSASILVSCRTLDEGFNVPDVGIGIIAASSSTSTQYIQRMGRILRKKSCNKLSRLYRISAKNTVDEYATFNLLSSGAVDGTRVAFREWDSRSNRIGKHYDRPQNTSRRLSACTVGMDSKQQVFFPGRTKKLRTYVGVDTKKLVEYLGLHNFTAGRFRISHDNNLYLWVNERFANVGRSPIAWQDLRFRDELKQTPIRVQWTSMYDNGENENE
jgi:superfamily II DNA or RNA helicase